MNRLNQIVLHSNMPSKLIAIAEQIERDTEEYIRWTLKYKRKNNGQKRYTITITEDI